jgi:hypothetical protein
MYVERDQQTKPGLRMSESNTEESHPAQKYTDNEIAQAVQRAQDELGAPAVGSNAVHEQLDYSKKQTRERLEEVTETGLLGRYNTGNGYIYWVPADDLKSGEVGVLALEEDTTPDLDSIAPEEFSEEKAQEIAEVHFDYTPQSFYQRLKSQTQDYMQVGEFAFVFGLGGLLLRGGFPFEYPDWVTSILAVLLFVGLVFVLIPGGVAALSIVLQKGVERGWLNAEPREDGFRV